MYSHGGGYLSPIGSSITPLGDTSETHLHDESVANSSAYLSYSSEYLTHQPMNESSDFGDFENESANQPKSSQDVFLELAERSQQVSYKLPCKLFAWPLFNAIRLEIRQPAFFPNYHAASCTYTYCTIGTEKRHHEWHVLQLTDIHSSPST